MIDEQRYDRAEALHLAQLCRRSYRDEWEYRHYQHVETVTYGTDDATLLWREGRLVIVFRGTERPIAEWIHNFTCRPVLWEPPGVHVHRGFLVHFRGLWQKLVTTKTYQRHRESRVDELLYAGHSRGGALAQLAGLHMQPDLVCSFGAPRVGGASFAERCRRCGLRHWRFVNALDVFARLPPGIWFRHYGRKIRSSWTGTHGITDYVEALA